MSTTFAKVCCTHPSLDIRNKYGLLVDHGSVSFSRKSFMRHNVRKAPQHRRDYISIL